MAHPPLTWGQVKAWAEANAVPDNAQVRTAYDLGDGSRPVRDISTSADFDDEPAVLTLLNRWG